MKNIFIALCCGFLLSSCGIGGKEGSATDKNTDNIVANIEITDSKEFHPQRKQIDVGFNEKTAELTVGNIIIKEGFPEEMPKSMKIYENAKTYINSNVKKYFFFTTESDKNSVYKEYKRVFQSSGWNEIKNPEVTFEEQRIFEFERKESQITIIFSEFIPENLQKLNLKGNYVEVYYY